MLNLQVYETRGKVGLHITQQDGRKLNLLLKQIVLDKNDLLYEKYNFIPCCKSVQVGPFFWMEITFGQFSAFAFS